MRQLTVLLLTIVLVVGLGALVVTLRADADSSSEDTVSLVENTGDTPVDLAPVEANQSSIDAAQISVPESKMSAPEIDPDFVEKVNEEFDWSTVNFENLSYG